MNNADAVLVRSVSIFTRLLLAVAGVSLANWVVAQDIEPRRWTSMPVGMDILGMGIAYTEGDISFDPVLRLSNATIEQSMAVVAYNHAFGILGKSARFDVAVQYKDALWEGLVDGVPDSADRTGPGDPRFRLSYNFIGAPALEGKAFRDYWVSHPVSTSVGAALALTLPLGDYHSEHLLNLGDHRYVLRPQLGVVHNRGPWSYELTGSVFFYSDNDNFFLDTKREQDPLYALQAHVVYSAPARWWVSIGGGHAAGGESTIDGVKKDDERKDWLYGISAGLPIGSRSSAKIAYVGRRSSEKVGVDSDTISMGYSISF